jgi:peptidoglycan glycosyltransferase
MHRPLSHTALAFLVAFALVAVSLVYWSVFAANDLFTRPDNVRLQELERSVQRGAIYDQGDIVLAESRLDGFSPSGLPNMQRVYPHLAAVSAIGYAVPLEGSGGIEASFDAALGGIDDADAFGPKLRLVEHRPRTGSDVRLTLDMDTQQAVADAFAGRRGAAVIIEVPTGAVRAMVSAPSFDPGAPDLDWEALRNDPAAPLLNRVTQGIYQPGGALQTVILAASLTYRSYVDAPIFEGAAPVRVNGLTLTCAQEPEESISDLTIAYSLACPALFISAVATDPGPTHVQEMIEAFGLTQPPALAELETSMGRRGLPLDMLTAPSSLWAAATGQGTLTVTPLHMAQVAAVIANNGNTVPLNLTSGLRLPGESWQSVSYAGQPSAVLTQDVAQGVRAAMRLAVERGAASAVQSVDLPPDVEVYGHAALAYTGAESNAWFVGFVTLPDGRSLAIALVLEATDDPTTAAEVAGQALSVAARRAVE